MSDYEVFVGPCAHGRDPWDRCEICGEGTALEAAVLALETARIEVSQLRQQVTIQEQLKRMAQAEVERLRTSWRWDAVKAHKRGAEVMREQAASFVGSDTALLQTYRSVLEGRIRALPIPEDKP